MFGLYSALALLLCFVTHSNHQSCFACFKRCPVHIPSHSARMTSAECPICLDFCSVDGEHRLVVTKCGHLFGHCCLLITLKTKKECPTCRKPLKPRDIVKIYDAKAMTNEHVSSEEDKSLELELQRERELREKVRLTY